MWPEMILTCFDTWAKNVISNEYFNFQNENEVRQKTNLTDLSEFLHDTAPGWHDHLVQWFSSLHKDVLMQPLEPGNLLFRSLHSALLNAHQVIKPPEKAYTKKFQELGVSYSVLQ